MFKTHKKYTALFNRIAHHENYDVAEIFALPLKKQLRLLAQDDVVAQALQQGEGERTLNALYQTTLPQAAEIFAAENATHALMRYGHAHFVTEMFRHMSATQKATILQQEHSMAAFLKSDYKRNLLNDLYAMQPEQLHGVLSAHHNAFTIITKDTGMFLSLLEKLDIKQQHNIVSMNKTTTALMLHNKTHIIENVNRAFERAFPQPEI